MPDITTLIFFLLATFGITMIVTKSTLFKPFRRLFGDPTEIDIATGKISLLWRLFNCPWCFGVWAGFAVRLAMMYWLGEPIAFTWACAIDVFLHGVIGGIFSYVAYLVVQRYEK